MARRIYWESVKKWALRAGVPVGIAGFALLFYYLVFIQAIIITGHSGDQICRGDINDPCLAYINFTAKEDIFIYPIGYDPWGRDTPFSTDEELKSWKMYRSWGTGWREIKLNETCTGTWCGAPNNLGVKYSFVFRDGRDYQIKIYALKKDPTKDVKWGFGPVDPVWIGITDIKNRTHIDKLRITDSIDTKNGLIKTYTFSTKEILIEDKDFKPIIKMRLTSPYSVSGLIASSDTKVAEFYLEDWKDEKINLIDSINFYDVKDDYKSTDKTFRFKWENVTEECFEIPQPNISKGQECYNYIEWIEFENLDELPHKNIKISMWADTERLESIEWIPTIEGFEIFQWAEWLVGTAVYSAPPFDVSGQDGNPNSIFFNPDGTKMYMLGYSNEKIFQYSLGTAWNITTASYDSGEDGDISDSPNPSAMFIKPDGTRIYVVGSGTYYADEYTLDPAWDIPSMTYSRQFDLSAQETNPSGIFFKPDGTKMYITGLAGVSVIQYNLTDAWNVSSAVYSAPEFSVSTEAATPSGISFKSDGTKMYVMRAVTPQINEYNLSTAWTLITASLSHTLDISGQAGTSRGFYINTDGIEMYVSDISNDEIHRWIMLLLPETINPNVTINQPLNQTYATTTISFNVTAVDDTDVDNCSYTLNSGLTNYTMLNMSTSPTYWTATNSTMSEGGQEVLYYCWDTIGNLNDSESRSFFIDSINPDINITYPINNTNWSDVNLDVNFTRYDLNLAYCWYSNDTYSVNSTPDSDCDNITNVVWSDAQHNVTIWINDTVGNENYSRISFTIDATSPDINITSPTNNTNWSDANLDVNFTRSDTHLEGCWYSNDTYDVNTTLPDCGNITNVVWIESKHNVTIWVNDTFGNLNWSSVGFTIDLTNPDINITSPINNSYSVDVGLDINITVSDLYLESCWYSNDTMEINTSLTCGENITAITWIEGQHRVIVWANDSASNLNWSSVNFTIDTTNPSINITSPINNTNSTNVNLNINFTRSDANLESCWYSNDSYLVNTSLANCGNITNVVWSYAKHNVTIWVNDTVSNENYSKISFTVYIIEQSILLREVELGSNVNISANTTLEVVCVDIDHPSYGINYSCSSDVNVSFNISYFRKTTLENGSSSIILENSNGFNTSNFSILSHQYDEVDSLIVNISGADDVRDVTFYKANTTNFDRAYNGILVGKYIYLQNFTDGERVSNFSFTTANTEITKYFYLDDKILDNGILNITMNVSGFEYGFEFLDNFENYSWIDEDETTLHLDPSGVIMMANSSLAYFIYDSYDSSFGPQWIAVPGTNAPTTETVNYIQTDATVPSVQTGTFSSRIYTNYSTNGLSLYTSDEIQFSIESNYDAMEDADANADGHSKVYLSNTAIWTSTYIEGFTSPSWGASEESYANITIILEKVNRTTWSVNISGWETSYVDKETYGSLGSASGVWNWTTGTWAIDSSVPADDRGGTLNNSFYQTVNYSYSYPLFIESIASTTAANDPSVTNMYTRMHPLNHSLWYRNNGTVTSKSVYDSSATIKSATFTVTPAVGSQAGEGVTWYLSADDGDNWEEVGDGAEHTFSVPGQHLKWRLNFTATNIGYLNITEALTSVNISVERGNPENITFDFGDDEVIDYTIQGEFNTTNGTLEISLGSADLSDSFTELRILYDHTYEIPLVISSASVGIIQVGAINITYDPNPVSLDVNTTQDFISNKTGRTNFSIVVGSYSGNITIDDIKFDYAGGNDTINITIHSPDYVGYLNQTNITLWYSRWDYNFVPRFVEYLEFIPDSPTSKNVSAYGQSSNQTIGAIINLTNYGYGGRNANLSIYLNETLSCVNLTMSLNNSKSDGFLINDSWFNIQKLSYLSTVNLWMWADYDCDYSTWHTFYPFIYFRQCCENCSCAEEGVNGGGM